MLDVNLYQENATTEQVGRFQINHHSFHLLTIEKQGQNTLKVNRGKVKIKIIAEIHETESRKTQQRKIRFLKKTNKIDKYLTCTDCKKKEKDSNY